MSRVEPSGALRQREPRRRNREHLAKVAQLPCIICAIQGRRTWPVEVAHCKSPYPEAGWRAFGHSEKGHDENCAPICSEHHRTGPEAQHRNPYGDEAAWWAHFGVYPPAFCAALVEAFAQGASGEQVVHKFARQARKGCSGRMSDF